jgi:tetratricopeptide (TPR) repeat protein
MFTGRHEELRTLERTLGEVRRGHGRFVAITGEAGLGKSRLLLEFRRTIESPDIAVVVGRCSSYGQATVYMPFADVLRQLLGLDSAARAAWTDAMVAAAVMRLDPNLEEFVPFYLRLLSVPTETYGVAGALPDQEIRVALEEGLVAALAASSARQPLAVLLEDWHWADPGSHRVLREAVDLVSTRQLLIVATSRSHSIELRQRDGSVSVELRPLQPASTGDMLKSILDAEVAPDELVARIHDRTGGNPFFVEEIARSLLESGTLRTIGKRVILRGTLQTLDLPATVQAVIRTRVDRFDIDARQVLRAASVIGRDFTRPVIEYAMTDAGRVGPALDTLTAARIVERTSDSPDSGYRFRHVLMQEAAYAGLLEHQRADLHARVGTAIEHIYRGQLDDWLYRLAQHFSLAEQWPKAVQYGLRSAERLTALGQFVEALQALDRTREWVIMLGDDHQTTAIDVLFRQERLCDTLGMRTRQRQIIDEIVELIESGDGRTGLAEAYLRKGDLHTIVHQFAEAEEALQRSLRLRRDTGDSGGERSTLRSLGFLRWNQERYDDALAYLNDALRIDRKANNLMAIVGDLQNLAAIHKAIGDHEQAARHLEEALRLSEAPAGSMEPVRVDRHWYYVHVLQAYGLLLAERGELDRSLEYLMRPVDSIRKARLGVQGAYFYTAIAQVHLKKGNLDECIRYYTQALEWSRRGRYQTGIAVSLRLLGELLLALGRERDAAGHLREAAAVFGELEDRSAQALMWTRVGQAEQRLGNLETANAAWEQALRLGQKLGDRRRELEALEALGSIARQRGPASHALNLYAAAIKLAPSIDDRTSEARLRNSAGIIEWTRGRYQAALAHYERALELFQACDDQAGVGLMMNSIGVTLNAVGRRADARRQLEAALVHHQYTGQAALEGHALAALGDLSWPEDVDEATAWYQRSLEKRQSAGDERGEGWMLQRLARVQMMRGHRDQVDALLRRATELSMRSSDEELMAACADLRRQEVSSG